MSPAFAIALWALSALPASGAMPPLWVEAAVRSSAPATVQRVAVVAYQPNVPAGCAVDAAEVMGAVDGSGAATVKLIGRRPNGLACEGWARLELKLF